MIVFCWSCVKLMVSERYRLVAYSMLMVVLPHICLFLYKIMAHGTDAVELIEYLILAVIYFAAAAGCINIRYLVKVMAYISVAGSAGIILQTVCHYVAGFHITMVPVSLLRSFAQQWVGAVTTGMISITGRMGTLYRPTAFFLEPAHVFIYTFPVLFLLLFSPDANRQKRRMASLISIGNILCTSGMGIFVTLGAWALYFASRSRKNRSFKLRNILRPRNLAVLVLVLVSVVVLYMTVPLITQAVNRVLFPNARGVTAIDGRTAQGMGLLNDLKGSQWLSGMSDSMSGYEFHITSFVETAYGYGLIGLLLYYGFYIRNMFYLKERFFWINLLLLVSFFSGHTHAIFMGLIYALILLEGYPERKKQLQQAASSRNCVVRGVS